MPLFFLHVGNSNGFVEDEEGHDLPDVEAARAKATAGARDIMSEDMRGGRLDLASFIEVEDENHIHLFTITFGEAVRIEG